MADTTPYRCGLCSVTFRQHSCEAVIDIAKRAGLSAIEWGTDVHLPAGDLNKARVVAAQCTEQGLATDTLGSYLRCQEGDDNEVTEILALAAVLGARRIRVWAGEQGSETATVHERNRIADRLSVYCDIAQRQGISIALEHHPDTLTDCATSSAALLQQVNHPALATYWQPTPDLSVEAALKQIDLLQHWLCDIHVFHWVANKQRRPLEEGRLFWQSIFTKLNQTPGRESKTDCYAFLEFVSNDAPEQCIEDASVLNSICSH